MGVEAAFVLEEMSVAACSCGAVSYDSMEETRRVTIGVGVGCGGQEIVPAWTRRWEGASGRSRAVETEVGAGFGQRQNRERERPPSSVSSLYYYLSIVRSLEDFYVNVQYVVVEAEAASHCPQPFCLLSICT